MKIVTYDSGFRFDDPNLYWGDPAYLLEPGDPGYVPVPAANPSPSTPKPQKHKMAKSDYISSNDDAFAAQLKTFQTNIGGYATTLGLSPEEVTAQAADAAAFGYAVACQKIMQQGGQQWTAWKDLLRGGGTPPATGAPVPPGFPAAVPPVAPGVEVRFRALVRQIKAQANYNDAIGEALDIEGAEQTPPDLASLQPVLKPELSGGMVNLRWGWQGQGAHLDMIELVVDRGDGKGFTPLAFDSTPNYTDTAPQPATPVKWKYQGIYRAGDQRVGQWSTEVSIIVGG